jgi:prepilin-type N-terminal cleavage/methylation domain-containing protein
MQHTNKHFSRGFTLVEVAIVLVIVGLIIGGLVTPLTMQLEQRKVSETQRLMDEAKEALYGFALHNGYLPCPAVSSRNGLEDRTEGLCTDGKRLGYLPWATLGLPRLDAWNHVLVYSVSPNFTNSGAMFTLRSARDISIATRDSGGALTPASMPNDIVAVLLSYGRNGFGATSDQNTRLVNRSATNVDEKLNQATDGTAFISRQISDNPAAPGGEFDDLVTWITPNILYNRMVAAQRLP